MTLPEINTVDTLFGMIILSPAFKIKLLVLNGFLEIRFQSIGMFKPFLITLIASVSATSVRPPERVIKSITRSSFLAIA